MDWSEERYARVYTRDTSDLLAFGWEGRLVWYELIRKVDRAGVLHHGGDLDVVPELLRVPHEVFAIGMARITKRGSAQITETAIVLPNYIEAQEAEKSDRLRQRESRARRRESAMSVTKRDIESQNVTDGHDRSHAVTKCHSVPNHSVPNQTEPNRAVPITSPPARDTAPPEAGHLALQLRELLVTEKPNHELAADDAWARKRPAWTKAMAALLRSGREAVRATELLSWVFGDQGGTEFRYRIDSPKALREKWDRIEVAMKPRRPGASTAPRGGRGMSAEEIFAMDMDEPIFQRGGG